MIFIIRALFLALVSAVAVAYTISTANDSALGQSTPIAYFVMVACVVAAFALFAFDMVVRRKNLHLLSGLFFGLLVGLVVSLALGFLIDQLANVFLGSELTSNQEVTWDVDATPTLAANVPGVSTSMPAVSHSLPLPPPTSAPTTATTRPFLPLPSAGLNVRVRPQHDLTDPANSSPWRKLIDGVKLLVGLMTTYITTSFILQTKDDFRFIIPYVEFSRASKGSRALFVDTSVIIDGRIADLAGTGIFEARMFVPRFVLNELHAISDSGDRLKRSRGRRGLDILQRLQANPKLDLHIWDGTLIKQPESEGVDQKLVALAQQENGRIVTNDFNLLKVAQLRGVEVINLNTIADALKPVVLPGEMMKIRIIKPGEGPTQGVGYLEDGTMVVVEGARDKVGTEIDIVVTNALQTAAGKMIFGRAEAPHDQTPPKPRA